MSLADISLLIQIGGLIALVVYVIKTWEMASATREAAEATKDSVAEMRDARDQETAPYVVAYLEVPLGSDLIYFVIKNIGRTTASEVKLDFNPLLDTSFDMPIEEMGFIKYGIQSMPPNFEIRALIDGWHSHISKQLTMQYNVTISYYGGIHAKQRTSTHILDLQAYWNIPYTSPKEMKDLIKEVKDLTTETGKIAKAGEHILTFIKEVRETKKEQERQIDESENPLLE